MRSPFADRLASSGRPRRDDVLHALKWEAKENAYPILNQKDKHTADNCGDEVANGQVLKYKKLTFQDLIL